MNGIAQFGGNNGYSNWNTWDNDNSWGSNPNNNRSNRGWNGSNGEEWYPSSNGGNRKGGKKGNDNSGRKKGSNKSSESSRVDWWSTVYYDKQEQAQGFDRGQAFNNLECQAMFASQVNSVLIDQHIFKKAIYNDVMFESSWTNEFRRLCEAST